jgi:hypothetical protein
VLKEVSTFINGVSKKEGLSDMEMSWMVESSFDDNMGDGTRIEPIFEDEDEDEDEDSNDNFFNGAGLISDIFEEEVTLVIDIDDAVVLPIELSFIVTFWHAAICFGSTKADNFW